MVAVPAAEGGGADAGAGGEQASQAPVAPELERQPEAGAAAPQMLRSFWKQSPSSQGAAAALQALRSTRAASGWRPNYGQGLHEEREPITLELPKRNASLYMASHFYLDDFPQSSEPLSDQPMPHTHVNPAEAFEADDEGYRGQPFPRRPETCYNSAGFISAAETAIAGARDAAPGFDVNGAHPGLVSP